MGGILRPLDRGAECLEECWLLMSCLPFPLVQATVYSSDGLAGLGLEQIVEGLLP